MNRLGRSSINMPSSTAGYAVPMLVKFLLPIVGLIMVVLTSCGTNGPNPNQYYLTVTVATERGGAVSLDPGGGVYDKGTRVVLNPNPKSVYRFKEWGGTNDVEVDKDNSIVMNGHKQAQSVFEMVGPPPITRDEQYVVDDLMEVTPLVYRGRLIQVESWRTPPEAPESYRIRITDIETGRELSRLAYGYGLASAIVYNDAIIVFASRYDPSTSKTECIMSGMM